VRVFDVTDRHFWLLSRGDDVILGTIGAQDVISFGELPVGIEFISVAELDTWMRGTRWYGLYDWAGNEIKVPVPCTPASMVQPEATATVSPAHAEALRLAVVERYNLKAVVRRGCACRPNEVTLCPAWKSQVAVPEGYLVACDNYLAGKDYL
jgi:hypothetical protein